MVYYDSTIYCSNNFKFDSLAGYGAIYHSYAGFYCLLLGYYILLAIAKPKRACAQFTNLFNGLYSPDSN